ncbi:MAG: tetratricopeptide repeat protein [Chthoniobacteraceae bacterium]
MSSRKFIALVLSFALCTGAFAQDSPLIIERYKQMLAKNPEEGVALDRIWKLYQDRAATDQLLQEYGQAAKSDFSSAMVLGLLLHKAAQPAEATKAFHTASTLDPKSPLPHLALAGIFSEQSNPQDSAAEYETAVGLADPKNPALSDLLFKLGSARLASGDAKKASEAWERVIAIDPKNLALRQKLAETYVANNLLDEAIPHYKFIEENGDPQQCALALQSLAHVFQMKGDPDSAIQSLEKAIVLVAPGNWLRTELQDQLIRQYQRSHRTAELETKWKKELEENPRDTGTYLKLIDLYERLGDPDQQSAVLKKLTDLLPDNLEYKTRLARLYSQSNQPDKAADLLDQILKAQPGNADALFARSEIDMQHDAPQSARTRIEAFLQQHQDDELLRTRAVDFYSSHRIFDAVEEHLKASGDDDAILALAAFYFSQRRDADARRTLHLLVKSDDPKEKQAAAHLKIADTLKEQKDMQGALEELKLAVALQPGSAEYHLAMGDILAGLNRQDEAREELEKAFQLASDESVRLEVDKKLFQTLQTAPSPQKEEAPFSIEELLRLGGPVIHKHGAVSAAVSNKALQDYIGSMIQNAEQHPTPEAMLRISRWETWSRSENEALAYAQKAVELQPDSVTDREVFVKIAATTQPNTAIAQLWKLIKLNPGKESAYTRQIARLMLESGKTEDAISLLTGLKNTQPGDVDILTDLAPALHQANRWDEELIAWQRAFDLAPAPRRKEIMPSLVRSLEQQGQSQKAAETMAKIADAQSDENDRASIFQDLLAFCSKHDLVPWLQSQYEQKLRVNADDYFVQVALSKILKSGGHETESLALLGDAAFSAPDQAAALRELVVETAEKGDFETAIACQKRVLTLAPQNNSADIQKLAELQENNLDLEGADSTWDKIVTKFSRDPETLSHAADYFQRWNLPGKARDVLRRMAALDPANLQTLMTLAGLANDAGDQKEALSGFEKALQNSTAKNEENHPVFPGLKTGNQKELQQSYFNAVRLRNGQPNSETMRALRSFWSANSEKSSGDLDLRLKAIRAISVILKNGSDKAAMQAWLARWQAPSVSISEALWAFYYSGAHDQVLKQLDGLLQLYPDSSQIKQGFVWTTLQMGEYEALSKWMAGKDRTADERDFFMISLSQMIAAANGSLDPKLLDGLFPPQYKSLQTMWQAAVQLAAHGYFSQAIKLGNRVFQASITLRPVYGVELAHWNIYAGDIDGARAVLKTSIASEGDSPDSMVYEDLREYYLLLPERERDSFVDSYGRSLGRNPLHAALSLSLLYGLQGDYDKARGQLSKLLNLRPMAYRADGDNTPASRTWTYILTAGVQFQLWRLNPLAVDLWEKALRDEAAISLQGNQVAEVVREIRMRLSAEKLAEADADETGGLIDDYLQSASPEIAGTLASVLENGGYYAQSVNIYQRLWQSQPDNQHFLQSLLNDCRAANDKATEKSTLQEAWERTLQSPPNMGRLQISLELIRLLVADLQDHAAQKVIEESLKLFPQNKELLVHAASLYSRQRRYDLAAKTYQQLLAMQPTDTVARDSLVDVLVASGKTDAAVAALEHTASVTGDDSARIATLYLQNGEFEKAERAAQQLLQARAYDQVPGLAAQLFAKGRNKEALQILLAALSRSKSANNLFELQSKLLENLPANTSPDLIERLMGQLESYLPSGPQPETEPNLETSFYDLQETLAKKFHLQSQLPGELAGGWRNGEGRLGAGLKLIQIQAQAGQWEQLHATCEALFTRPDFNEQLWNNTQAVLEQAGQYELIAKGWKLIALKNPLHDEPVLQYVRALVSCGRKEDAAIALEKLGCRHVFNDITASEVAREYCNQSNYEAAGKWYGIAITKNPAARAGDVYLQYAWMLMDQKNFAEAKKILLMAFRNPSGNETHALARYFVESGHVDRIGSEIREFGLTPGRAVDFYGQLLFYYQQHGEPLKAIAVAEEHPEIITANRDVPKWLRAAAEAAGAFEKAAALLEKVIAQSSGDVETNVSDELALIYRDWPDAASVLGHLKRANELKPLDFEIASSLSKLYLDNKQPQQASQVLTQYVNLAQDQALKEQAKALLARIPAG